MPGKPISKATADSMIEDYISYMTGLGVDMKKQTQNVSFSGPEVMSWLNKNMAAADELRICMGLYPLGHPQAGKTTVIFWPYKDGQPVSGAALGLRGGGGDDGGGNGDGDDDDEDDGHGPAYNEGSGTP
ncbi:MAG: hypothetical protein WDO16_21900 [Bacteroidota bacterium]